MGLSTRKTFNIHDKLKELKEKADQEDQKQVEDPYTVKVRKLTNDATERELTEIMRQYGDVTRVKIPIDEKTNQNKGFAFVTFKHSESATRVIDQESIKYEFYELPVERATQSKGKAMQQAQIGGFGTGKRGGRREDRDRKNGGGDF